MVPSEIPTSLPTATSTPTPEYDYWFVKLEDRPGFLIHDAVITLNGGLALVGDYASFQALWLAKLNRFAAFEWQESIAAGNSVHGLAITSLPEDNIVVGGALGGDGYALYLDAQGHPLWQKTYDVGGGDHIRLLEQASGGQLAFAGESESANNHQALWVGTMTLAGEISWQHLHRRTIPPETFYTYPIDLAVINGQLDIFYFAANVYVGHPSLIRLGEDGRLLRDWVYESRTYEINPRGYWVSGDGSFLMNSLPDRLVFSDSEGQPLWEHRYPATTILTVNKTSAGDYLVGGSIWAESYDRWGLLMKINPRGEIIWSHQIGQSMMITHFMEAPSGDLIAVGEDNADWQGNRTEYFFLRLNAQGKIPGCDLMTDIENIPYEPVTGRLPLPSPAPYSQETPLVSITNVFYVPVETEIGLEWLCQANP